MAIDDNEMFMVALLKTIVPYPEVILKLVAEYSADEYIWIVDNIAGELQSIYNYCPDNISTKHRLIRHRILLKSDQFVEEKIPAGCIYVIPYTNDFIYVTECWFNPILRYVSYDLQFLKKVLDGPRYILNRPDPVKLMNDHSL